MHEDVAMLLLAQNTIYNTIQTLDRLEFYLLHSKVVAELQMLHAHHSALSQLDHSQ